MNSGSILAPTRPPGEPAPALLRERQRLLRVARLKGAQAGKVVHFHFHLELARAARGGRLTRPPAARRGSLEAMVVPLEEAVERVRRGIDDGSKRLALRTEPGSGKIAVLDALAATVNHGRRVVRIAFPEGDDAALAALVDTAAGIGLLERIVPQEKPAGMTWPHRIGLLREGLERVPEDLVLLVDDPRFNTRAEPEEDFFAERAVELTTTLLRSYRGPIVLAGIEIPVGAAEDAGVWFPPSVVKQILTALKAGDVGTPHDQRLNRLVDHDLAYIFRGSAGLRRVMARLAAFRVPFSRGVLHEAGFAELSRRESSVMNALVLTVKEGAGEDATFVVPRALSHAIRARIAEGHLAWAPDEPAGEAYRFAAGVHRARFEAAGARGDVFAAVREELEEIHQLTEAGDATGLLDRSLQFVEQYDALGKSLSRRALHAGEHEEELRRQAVRAYERAIEHEPGDAYAHHYIAYNLDILASERERVEREYVIAKGLDRGHPWYHSRHVCFLITTVWIDEARAAWERALDDLVDAGGALRDADYEHLHKQVARLLLERGRLDFAAEVLDDVPEDVRGAPWWRALDQLRVCLEEDRDERLVFPPTLPIEERWDGPHLIEEGGESREVKRWRPGRVLGRDEDVVDIVVAERAPRVLRVDRQHPLGPAQVHAGGEVSISTMSLDAAGIEESWEVPQRMLSVRTFVELIEYTGGSKEMKVWSRPASSFKKIPELPRLFPRPDRYIRRAFADPHA